MLLVALTVFCVLKSVLAANISATIYEKINFEGSSKTVVFDRCINFDPNWKRQTSSIDTKGNCLLLWEKECCQGKALQVQPGSPSHSNLVYLNFNDIAVSISPCGNYKSTPPNLLKESWLGQNQIVHKVSEGADVTIYYDSNMEDSISWQARFIEDVWGYVKRTYGSFGPDNGRLYAVFHPEDGVSNFITYLGVPWNPDTCINIVDYRTQDGTKWKSQTSTAVDVITQELAHIVEFASKKINGSPSFEIWGASKWVEIFRYDIYVQLGMMKDAIRCNETATNLKTNFPGQNTFRYWYRDWFYPIYSKYGGGQVLARYFELVAKYFPKQDGGSKYARNMNFGEFVHFWSGATGFELRHLARDAFGWSDEYENQFIKAKTEFPIHYVDQEEDSGGSCANK